MAKKKNKINKLDTVGGKIENPKIDMDSSPKEKKKAAMTETELLAIVDNAIKTSLGQQDSKLANDRLQAMKYYLGDKEGNLAPPEAEGRSSVVSMDVADTIEWILPTLLRLFLSGDDAVEFTARNSKDVAFAEQSTIWANYVFYTQNDGFITLHDWFKDALLQKLGIVKTWWDNSKDVTTEEYFDQTLDEITMMLEDGTVEVIQKTEKTIEPTQGELMEFQQAQAKQASMPQMPGQPPLPPLMPPQPRTVYDIKVKRTTDTSHICIENVPPEEFLFSKKARTASRMFHCHHRIQRTVSELKEAGYKNTDELLHDENGAEFSQETVERNSDTQGWTQNVEDSLDPSMRMVWITESYMQVDWNNDGLAEWRKIVKSGKILLDNEEVDDHLFSIITPIKMPHKLVGRSIADLVMDLQDIKTALRRQIIDNTYLRNNPRTYVDTSKKVNIDDLLDSRVGGIVRGNGPDGIQPIVVQDLSPLTYMLMQDLDKTKQERTGLNPQMQGSDVNAINKTATESNNLLNSAMARIEMIARIFAETGVKDLFKRIQKLSGEYQKEAQVVRLTGNKFVQIDPRAWKTQYNFTINVGLGNGNKDQMVGHITNIMAIQKEAKANGLSIVSDKQIYNSAKKLAIYSGFKDAGSFFVDPDSDEGKAIAQANASKPNPEMMKLQAQTQAKQQEAQFKQQSIVAQNEVQKANDERDFQRQQQKDQNDYNLRMAEIKANNEYRLQELAMNAQMKREEMDRKFAQEREHKLMDYELELLKQKNQHSHETTTRNSAPTQSESMNFEAIKGISEASVNGMAQIAAALANGGKKEITINRQGDGSMVGTVTPQG